MKEAVLEWYQSIERVINEIRGQRIRFIRLRKQITRELERISGWLGEYQQLSPYGWSVEQGNTSIRKFGTRLNLLLPNISTTVHSDSMPSCDHEELLRQVNTLKQALRLIRTNRDKFMMLFGGLTNRIEIPQQTK